MGEAMALRDEDIGRIGDYVKPWLRSVVEDMIPRHEPGGVGAQLLERMVRVEEELKSQRLLMDERFGFMEHRFAAMDKRFEELLDHTNSRFEAVDKRFEAVDRRFEELLDHTNSRFEAVDKRFEAVDKRFEAVDKRFEESIEHTNTRFADLTAQMNARFTSLSWMIGVGFVVITSLTTLYALLA